MIEVCVSRMKRQVVLEDQRGQPHVVGQSACLAYAAADASLTTDVGASPVLSPDGSLLAFTAQQNGVRKLFVRKLDQLNATLLAGTDGAMNPFFSPDGQ